MVDITKEERQQRRKITTVSELPDWFKSKKYTKVLSDVQWYTEINFRVLAFHGFLHNEGVDSPELKRSRLNHFEKMINMELNPNSVFMHHKSNNPDPIYPISALETLYLASTFKTSHPEHAEVLNSFDDLLSTWKIECNDRGDFRLISYEYEKKLDDFFTLIEANSAIESAAFNVEEMRNPFLSYGDALRGVPVVVDTRFDDATLIASFQSWLKLERTKNQEKIRRPFIQDDFDDWAYYKLREIHDLDLWAKWADVQILDSVIAAALWPNAPDSVSPIDVLRTTGRKNVASVFTFANAIRFYYQLRNHHGEKIFEENFFKQK